MITILSFVKKIQKVAINVKIETLNSIFFILDFERSGNTLPDPKKKKVFIFRGIKQLKSSYKSINLYNKYIVKSLYILSIVAIYLY